MTRDRSWASGSSAVRRGSRAALVGAALLIGSTGCALPAERATPDPQGRATAATARPHGDRTPAAAGADRPRARSALAALGSLPVKGRAPMTGYDREAFGPEWFDADGNGCDTRNDVLGRYLEDRVHDPSTSGCVVTSAVLQDPYTGRTIDFVRGDGVAVDIDHVVSLGNAWATGAARWTAIKRTSFANDPVNLLPVDAAANRQKADGDAATWLPPNKGYRCRYVARQVAVKSTYGLWVTPAEAAAIERVLEQCPHQSLPDGRVAPRSSTRPGSAGTGTVYDDCAAAAAAGAAPVRRGDPGYGSHLDGDGDGHGCE